MAYAFLKVSLRLRYNCWFLNKLPKLEVQTITFYFNSLRWWYKQLLSQSTPYAGGANSCFYINSLSMFEVQTVAL